MYYKYVLGIVSKNKKSRQQIDCLLFKMTFHYLLWLILRNINPVNIYDVLIFTTFLAYLFNIIALKRVNPSVVGVYVYLQPVLATIVALMIGKDSLSMLKIISAILIFIGVYLVSYSGEKDIKSKA